MASKVSKAEHMAHDAASSRWMTLLARLGYAIKGVVYLIIGILALQLVFGSGGSTTDQRGAIERISALPFGKFLLIIVAIGLFGFALWSFIQAIYDTEGQGGDAKGIVARVGYAIVGLSYGSLGYAALQIVMGSGSNVKSSTTSTQDWTSTLLRQPFGQALVVILGLIVLGVACYLYYKAYAAKFQRRLYLTDVAAQNRKLVITIGRVGYAALGVVFTIVGLLLIVAAAQNNASKAVGLDGALLQLQQQSFGPILLAIVALGLIAYGVYSFVEARYRRIGR